MYDFLHVLNFDTDELKINYTYDELINDILFIENTMTILEILYRKLTILYIKE